MRPLLGDQHDRAAFSCGVETLDRYFRAQAGQDSRKRVATCFVVVGQDGSVAGYYALSATSVLLVDPPSEVAKKLPRYPAIPATLLGRLAVDRRQHGRGLGELLLFDAFSRTLRSEIASFAFVVDAKDEAAQAFYEHYGFRPLPSAGRRLFLPLAEIAASFA
ncbi:MAG: GNAT family N-acetyltransferase [Deltaproteobacteria bacterium]|nr:GNAT family N-acetyltransferase [Deltaproteobacteria bacterium]